MSSGEPAFEALVIGGGPAGLAAAVYLARFRRRVLLIEDGASRAAQIPCSHNTAGFPDGIVGVDLLARMRAHAARYGVRMEHARIESLHRNSAGFRAEWAAGAARAMHVVLATGVSDVAPPMPHLQQAVRDGVLRYCPVCDGFEAIGRDVGIVVDSACDFDEVLYLRHFSDRITVFVVAPDVPFTGVQSRSLEQAGVTLVREPVSALRMQDGRAVVRHGERQTLVDSLYCALGMRVHSQLATALGADHDKAGYLLTDHHQQTSVPGLYAAGDVVKGLNQIAVALGGAAIAASAIHLSLLERQG